MARHDNIADRAQRAARFKAVRRAMLLGAVAGSVATILPLAAAAYFGAEISRDAGGAGVTVAAALGAVTFGISTAMNPPPRMKNEGRSAHESAVAAGPYRERLGRFLADDVAAPVEPIPRESKTAFFLAHFGGRRFAPKSAAVIREALLRIHRLLHRGS